MIGVVLNPIGGRGSAKRKWEEAKPLFDGLELKVRETQGPGHARVLAKELAEDGCGVVMAAGGDGTVSHVMNGLLGSSTALAVMPLGTGNDLARTLGIGTDCALAVEALRANHQVGCDVIGWRCGEVHDHGINVAGCGFDATVAERINKGFRWVSGTGAYYAGILSVLATYKPINVLLTFGGTQVRTQVMLCAVANATCYGGGLRIAPRASIEDGLLDVVAVGALGRAEFLRNFPKLMKGTHLKHPKVKHYLVPEVTIETEHEAVFLSDGEVVRGRKMECQVLPRAIQVVVGKNYMSH